MPKQELPGDRRFGGFTVLPKGRHDNVVVTLNFRGRQVDVSRLLETQWRSNQYQVSEGQGHDDWQRPFFTVAFFGITDGESVAAGMKKIRWG